MTLAIIGLGLIGGSLALRCRAAGELRLLGVDTSAEHARLALERGLVDAVLPLDAAVEEASMIVLAVPVDAATALLPTILDRVGKQIVFDVGSTKARVIEAVRAHPQRGRFVATHPMWGTEHSGPLAAMNDAFSGKAAVICDAADSDADALAAVGQLYGQLEMHLVEMDAGVHDLHAAYVSHISHVTSFALANTVLAKEREDAAIFELASGGFASTVRLAKSNPAMWMPIFQQNRVNVLDVLDEHIRQLEYFKSLLENENYPDLQEFMQKANQIKRILK